MTIDYSTVTELPGSAASKEQLAKLYHRYHFASLYCKDKDVLEVACGGGIGLGYLAKSAKTVTGGDVDEHVLKYAHEIYKGRENIEVRELDAHDLLFEDSSFDVVILYEAIYYLSEPERFIDEAKRVLRDDGRLVICTVNKGWSDFNPSPYSITYLSSPELYRLLSQRFGNVAIYGAFAVTTNSVKDKVVSLTRRAAVVLHLMPKTMKGKEFLKRIFFGKLRPLPREVSDGMVEYDQPQAISHNEPDTQYKVLYAVAQVKGR